MLFRAKSATIKLMKIALASDLFWPMINGISVFTKNLAEQIAKRGHEVVVFAPSQNGDYYVEEVDGYKVVRLSSVNFPFYPNQTEPLAPPRKIAGRITVPRVYLNTLKNASSNSCQFRLSIISKISSRNSKNFDSLSHFCKFSNADFERFFLASFIIFLFLSYFTTFRSKNQKACVFAKKVLKYA